MEHFSDILLNEGIVARDSSMVKLYSDALSIAPTDANILIVGASGTGKDCLAKFIHRHSPRAGAPFIHINCSAIPAELFESEFFGYEDVYKRQVYQRFHQCGRLADPVPKDDLFP